MKRKILIMGLPGAGKTTLSKAPAPRINVVHFNADEVRANVNKDLGFAEPDRIENARRMGWLCGGHKALIVAGLKRVGQVRIAVRNMHHTDEKNPFEFEYVCARIEHGLREYEGRFLVVPLPNITSIFYGRDVGYTIERIDLDSKIETISAIETRRKQSSQAFSDRGR